MNTPNYQEDKEIQLWKPINFNENWRNSNTSILDDLTPSWFRRRKELKDGNEDYEEFVDRLKRQHAIETGIVEKLYDLSEGITETLIKEGFVESYLSHDDTNIPPQQLMSYLKDHFEALDFIFDMVKNERPLTISFIKQLHQLITKHQDFTIAVNSLGERVQVKLLKGEFKQSDNNPKREDGGIFMYCPFLQVAPEMDKLISIYNELWSQKYNSVIIAAWFHHAFTQIHPFQDGNGRMARLLSSLILIKGDLFPFTIKRDEKVKYIDALEKADLNQPQDLVSLFCNIEKRNIETALNYKSEKNKASIEEVAKLFTEKIDVLNSQIREQRQKKLERNRTIIFDKLYESINEVKTELFQLIPYGKARIFIENAYPKDEKYYWYTLQIAGYATTYKYYFNRYLPRGWFKISFNISNDKKYDLVISVHHFGFDDSVIAVGSFLEFTENLHQSNEEKTNIPVNIKPFTISLEGNLESRLSNLEQYVRDVVKVGLTIIANEIV